MISVIIMPTYTNWVVIFFAITLILVLNCMSKRQNSGKEAPSRVLLVCVYDTIVLNITNEIVYARFSEYGNILKILIFEKG